MSNILDRALKAEAELRFAWQHILKLREERAELYNRTSAKTMDRILELENQLAAEKARAELAAARETCQTCKRDWNPSLIESGECVFCILKAQKQRANTAEAIQHAEKDILLKEIEAHQLTKARADKAEAACASLCDCIDSVFSVILERANSNMLHLHEGKGDHGIPDGSSSRNPEEKKTMQGMPTSQSQGKCSENRSEAKACEELAGSKGKEPGTISRLHQDVSRETPGEINAGLSETRPIQSKMQNSTSQCCCVWENKETEEMCAVRLDWSSSRASRRLQQAVERAMALHNMSRKEASQILNAISTDCGKPLLEKLKMAREALELVAECFPAHSMVKKALAALKEEK